MEVMQLKEMFVTDGDFKLRVENADQDLYQALKSDNQIKLQRIVASRRKD